MRIQYKVTKDSFDSMLRKNDVFCFDVEKNIHVSSSHLHFICRTRVDEELTKIEYQADREHALKVVSQLQNEIEAIKKAYKM